MAIVQTLCDGVNFRVEKLLSYSLVSGIVLLHQILCDMQHVG